MLNLRYVFSLLECGHFCIRYVLKNDGKKVNRGYCRKLMSLGLVKRVLKEYYRRVDCYVVNDIFSVVDKGKFITLIKGRRDNLHYVVVVNVKGDYVYYYDPAYIGIRKSKVSRFVEKWSHYCCFYSDNGNC